MLGDLTDTWVSRTPMIWAKQELPHARRIRMRQSTLAPQVAIISQLVLCGHRAMHTDNMWKNYKEAGFTHPLDTGGRDPAGQFLPLVHQANGTTTVMEQPLDFTHLAEKYKEYVVDFIQDHKEDPFFLYMPFSHVHTTAGNQPEKQFAGCAFKNSTKRGMFGDALAEADWIASAVIEKLEALNLDKNTLILFSSVNGQVPKECSL